MSTQRFRHQHLWPAAAAVPLLGFAAFSGTGKTTLLRRLIPLLTARGLRIGLIKHAHHGFEIDHPGKDSFELRKAGASQVLVTSSRRSALMIEHARPADPQLAVELGRLNQSLSDLILVEGFKHERFPKIELCRPALGHPLLAAEDDSIIAVASDQPEGLQVRLPLLDINAPDQIARFILDEVLQPL